MGNSPASEFYIPTPYKIQTPGNYPEKSMHHSEHDKSSKSRIAYIFEYDLYEVKLLLLLVMETSSHVA
jgi:hypothetical protein